VEDEEVLTGGNVAAQVVRVGATVRKSVVAQTAGVEAVLEQRCAGGRARSGGAGRGRTHAGHLASGLLASVRAAAARDLGRPEDEQRAATRNALRRASAQADPQILLEVVEHVAGCLVDRGDSDAALRLLRAARRIREEQGVGLSVPRHARRHADEARASSTAPDLAVRVDLPWLTAAATEALG